MIEVLGDVRAASPDDRDEVRAIGSRSQRLVLAALVAHHGTVVTADSLIDALWGEHPPSSARRTLSSYVSRLRARLGSVVEIVPNGYRLTTDREQVDAHRFEDVIRRAENAPPELAVELLRTADGLWRGPAFAEFADEDIVRGEALRLTTLRLDGRDRLADALLRSGRITEAIALATEIVAEQSLRESSWVVLVDAQAVSAPGEAIRAYRRAVAALAEAGLVPSAALRAAEARALAGETVAVPRTPTPPLRLPSLGATLLFGRKADLDRVTALLDDQRLVTLVGPGGVGKTRLAVESARQLHHRYRAGAAFVGLDELTDPESVVPATLESIGLGSIAGSTSEWVERLAALDALVVLDNCEHVADAVADLVERLLTPGGSVRILATSRQRLGVDGERLVAVTPLGAAEPESDGVQMFVDRAAASGVDVDPADEAVARIVRNLDGLPLGIEMAAALLTSHALDDVLAATDADVSSMRSPRRGAPRRQRSLADLIDWSLARLDPAADRAMTRLATLEGAFDGRLAYRLLGGDSARAIHDLVERSLLTADTRGRNAEYRMLQTVKSRVRKRCPGAVLADASRDHAHLVAEEIEACDRLLRTVDERSAHLRILDLYADLRSAHRWCSEHEPRLAVHITRHLHVWAMSRQYGDPFRWAEGLAAEPSTASPAVAAVHSQALFYQGRHEDACAWAEAALERAEGLDALFVLESLGDIALATGALARAFELGEALARAAEDADDPHFVVMGRAAQVLAHRYAGDTRRARSLLERLDGVAPTDRGWARYVAAEVLAHDDPALAAEHLHAAIASADDVGNRFLGGVARVALSALHAREGNPGTSVHDLLDAMRDWRRRGMHAYLITAARNLVVILDRLQRAEDATRLLGTIQSSARIATYGDEAAELDEVRSSLERKLGAERFESILGRGASCSLGDIIDELAADPTITRSPS